MMRKNVSRLLALVLVLCMVVLCVPVRAYAVDLTRPEGITDEEWQILRQKLLAKLAEEQAKKQAEGEIVTETTLPETDSLSKSDTGNLTVSDQATVPADVPAEAKDQTVSVELPAQADVIATEEDGTVTNEYKTTIEADGEDTEVSVEESYDLSAEVTKVETEGTGDSEQVTDITYEVSLNAGVSAEEKAEEASSSASEKVVKDTVVENVDKAADKAATEETLPAPQYKVNMTVNGMKDAPTRVEHTYTTTKKVTDSNGTETETTVTETEYYYNADNDMEGTDANKKYFTVSEVEKNQTTSGGIVETVTEKVVSLWTNFLGIFHVTNDAFEGSAKEDGSKNTYSTLTDAAEANSGKTVEMLRDYETASTATISNGVSVDLNDHVYTNTSDTAAIAVNGNGTTVAIENGAVISDGDGVQVEGKNNKFSLKDLFLRANDDGDTAGDSAAISISGSNNVVSVEDSYIDGADSKYGIQDTSAERNIVNIEYSSVLGQTGVGLKNTNATISGSDVSGISGAAVEVDGNTKSNSVIITSGRFDSGKYAHDIYAEDNGDIASIIVKGGKFNDPAGLYKYIAKGYALMSHNDGSYYVYEVVPTSYTPSRDGYRFLGFTDGNGKAITLADAYARGIVAYAQWKAIPEKTVKAVTVNDLIKAKTDEKGCTIKVNAKGDTAYIIVKDKNGEIAPISEVKISSVKQLQNLKIDTIEIQVDEDVTLVLDIEKAKKNGFADDIEVTLEKDTLMITSGEDTCMELDIAELKASDKPVEIQLVEGELTVMLGKSSSLSVDLTKALKTGERIVVKLENGVLKLYDKYNKPIEET